MLDTISRKKWHRQGNIFSNQNIHIYAYHICLVWKSPTICVHVVDIFQSPCIHKNPPRKIIQWLFPLGIFFFVEKKDALLMARLIYFFIVCVLWDQVVVRPRQASCVYNNMAWVLSWWLCALHHFFFFSFSMPRVVILCT